MAYPTITAAPQMTLNDTSGSSKSNIPLARLPSDKDGLNELSIARGANAWARFKFEWKFENLWFNGDYPNTYGKLHWAWAFGNSGAGCWCCSRAYGDERDAEYQPLAPWKWLLWRCFVMAYLTGVFIYSITQFWHDGTWFYYLTNWQSTIFMIYGVLSLITAWYIHIFHSDAVSGSFEDTSKIIGAHRHCPHGQYKVPILIKATWISQGLAMSLGIWVTLMFWLNAAIFGPPNPGRVAHELIDHFSTIFLVILDFSFAAFPWLLFQFVWSSFIAIAYIIWSVIHFELGLTNKFDGGNYLYRGIDWHTPVQTGFAVIILLVFGIPIVSITVWLLSSEMMGSCAPQRLVPWVDQDGSGGHRLKSYKKDAVKRKEDTKLVAPADV